MSCLGTYLETFEVHLQDSLRASESVAAQKNLGLAYAASDFVGVRNGQLSENVVANLRALQQQQTRVAELLGQIADV